MAQLPIVAQFQSTETIDPNNPAPTFHRAVQLLNVVVGLGPDGLPETVAVNGSGSAGNCVSALALAQNAVDPVVVTAPSIAKLGSGLMLVSAFLSGVAAAGGVITAQLGKDGAALPAIAKVATGGDGANTWSASVVFLDTAADAAGHVYKLTCTSGSTTETVVANHGGITVCEQ
jgi:hypothetical protein